MFFFHFKGYARIRNFTTPGQAVDYEVDVIVKRGGFEALTELTNQNQPINQLSKCGPTEKDISGKDSSTLSKSECQNCLKHIYS